MIYYYHEARTGLPKMKIEGWNGSFNLEINVNMWFPNTKAKVKTLLNIIKENDEDDRCASVLATLVEDLKVRDTFNGRVVKSSKTFCRMLNSNIEQIRIYSGLYC